MRYEIEILRIIGAFGIVWFHSGIKVGHDIAYAGLVIFVIISSYFSTISTKEHRIYERAIRILVPCLIWSVFFAAFKIARGVNVFPENYNLISKLFATPSIHLWFLPFIFFVNISIEGIKKYFDKGLMGIFSGFFAIVLISTAPEWRTLNLIPPFGQYLHALPAVLIGVFFACYDNINKTIRTLIIFGIFLAIMAMVSIGLSGIGTTYLFGFIPCLIILKKHPIIGKNNLVTELGKATFGVYLSHVFAIFILRHIGITGILLPTLSFIITILAVLFVRKYFPSKLVKFVV